MTSLVPGTISRLDTISIASTPCTFCLPATRNKPQRKTCLIHAVVGGGNGAHWQLAGGGRITKTRPEEITACHHVLAR